MTRLKRGVIVADGDRETRVMTNVQTTVAYHEAAHAVACVRRGGILILLTIQPNADSSSRGCEISDEVWNAGGPEDVAYVIELLAGYSAQLALGDGPEADVRAGAADDFEQAKPYLIALGRTEAQMLAVTAVFVHRDWRAITAVALQLLKDSTLDAAEVGLIVADADGTLDIGLVEALHRYRALRHVIGSV